MSSKRKIDLLSIIGIIVGLGGLGMGFYLEGGNFASLVAPSPILIIFGGTFGALIVTMDMNSLKQIPQLLKIVYTEPEYNFQTLIQNFSEWTKVSRREGIVALGEIADKVEDPFTKRGLEYILEGNDYETIKELLDKEIENVQERHHRGAMIFENAGGFAPTMGIMGAVLGLVVVLAGLGSSDVSELGHGISVAFLATLMGVGFANLIVLPMAGKLKNKSNTELLYKSIVVEGILGIQSGQNPKTLRHKMVTYLPEKSKNFKAGE
jgi:chemotaxis protein MotA